jgi:site-specific recombinase
MSIETILNQVQQSAPRHPLLLKQLLQELGRSPKDFEQGIALLESSEANRLRLKHYIGRVFYRKDLTYVLVDSGISRRTGFIPELVRKIKHTIIPEEKDKAAFHETLRTVFSGNTERLLSEEQLATLFRVLQIGVDFNDHYLKRELIDAIEILSYRITATAIESEFLNKFRRSQTLNSFVKQNKEVHALIAQHILGVPFNPQHVIHIKQLLSESVDDINLLKRNSHHQGASLQFTYTLHRISQQIERLKVLFDIYLEPVLTSQRLATFIHDILHSERDKNSIRKQLNETTYLLAYQIAEHESKTGEHYIAENAEEYKDMFVSSSKGGGFASLMTLAKVLLHHLSFAPFWQAFSYSMNYAAGFVGIQLTHSTLATKQPAMTASRIAHSLDKKDSDENSIRGLALMMGKVSRSQFISFAGNLLVVFPLSFAIAAVFQLLFGKPIVDVKNAQKMLRDVHPFLTPTWFYACITGVFLFLSGIISGYCDNKVIYSNIPLRIRHHAGLQRVLRKRALVRLSRYVETNLGSLIGNISLGFFLGMAGFIGFIFGLPFDIRHITISSGNYAIALFTLMGNVTWSYALTCLGGVMGIGFFNFMISFGLALFVAARSRRVRIAQFADLIKWTGIYFKRYPRDFFLPPKQERTIDELKNTLS